MEAGGNDPPSWEFSALASTSVVVVFRLARSAMPELDVFQRSDSFEHFSTVSCPTTGLRLPNLDSL